MRIIEVSSPMTLLLHTVPSLTPPTLIHIASAFSFPLPILHRLDKCLHSILPSEISPHPRLTGPSFPSGLHIEPRELEFIIMLSLVRGSP